MRDSFKNINIVGAMLVSRDGELLHYTIPGLLRWCDWILLMMDNEDEQSREIVMGYKKKYPKRIQVSHSGVPRISPEQEAKPMGLFRRFRPLQAKIRETVLEYMRKSVKEGKEIDILLWPDADELFRIDLPVALKELWNSPKKAITSRPLSVFGDMKTIIRKSQPGHVRVFKFFPELTAVPYAHWCCYRPLERKRDVIASKGILIHLAYLNQDRRTWRDRNWRPDRIVSRNKDMWFLPKDVREMSSEDIDKIIRSKPDSTTDEYLKNYE